MRESKQVNKQTNKKTSKVVRERKLANTRKLEAESKRKLVSEMQPSKRKQISKKN